MTSDNLDDFIKEAKVEIRKGLMKLEGLKVVKRLDKLAKKYKENSKC